MNIQVEVRTNGDREEAALSGDKIEAHGSKDGPQVGATGEAGGAEEMPRERQGVEKPAS